MPSPTITRRRCPACGQLSISFGAEPFQCRNTSCSTDVTTRVRYQTREEFMRDFSVVYYIAFADRIKIGVTTNLAGRLAALPHDEFLAFELGDRSVEQRRHRQFEHARVAGQREWFHRTPDLLAHIEALAAGMDDPRAEASRAVKRAILGLVSA